MGLASCVLDVRGAELRDPDIEIRLSRESLGCAAYISPMWLPSGSQTGGCFCGKRLEALELAVSLSTRRDKRVAGSTEEGRRGGSSE